METPVLKDWCCDDEVDGDIETWAPADPYYVDYYILLTIGRENDEGGDNFYARVVTDQMMSHLESKEFLIQVPVYTGWPLILEKINDILDECKDINWHGMSEQLAKYFSWEYGDYN